MNTKIIRFVFALMLAIGVLGTSASAAQAAGPDKDELSFVYEYTFTNVCSFDVQEVGTVHITYIDFVDKDGAWIATNWHVIEQDTFSANGKTLVGIPFTFSGKWTIENGIVTHLYASGVSQKIPLPDGRLFIAAGRVDFVAIGMPASNISPEKGNPGDIAAFCAALS